MTLKFRKFCKDTDKNVLVDFLSNNTWPFHVDSQISVAVINDRIDGGIYDDQIDSKTFLAFSNKEEFLGMIRIFDLDDAEDGDGSPLFDMRIANAARGKGLGNQMIAWLTSYLFNSYPNLNRIEATTRIDNIAMRKILKNNFYLKEGHYRESWPTSNGDFIDTIRYGILRNDWINQTITSINWDDL